MVTQTPPQAPATPQEAAAVDIAPAPFAPAPPPQVIVQMITPQAGEPTEGLSEIRPGGDFLIHVPDPANPGKTKTQRVDAYGKELK
jgi:hypothetical protein